MISSALVLSWHQYRLERRMFWRNPSAAFFNFFLPLLFLGLFGNKTVAPLAYTATIRVDSTLLGQPRGTLWVTFFAPRGARTPAAGTSAIWVLHRRALWRLQRCAEQQGFTSTACPYDIGLALDSDDDVRPVDEWPRIRAILRALRLGTDSVD